MDLWILKDQRCLKTARCVTGIKDFSFNWEVREGYLELLKHNVATQILHELMGFSLAASISPEARSETINEKNSLIYKA